jgi:M6 family metalloprotease-like protein
MKTIKLLLFAWAIAITQAQAQTNYVKGLTVMVEFSDAPFNKPEDSIAMMMNQPGFSGWGNEGSVRDYYLTQTNGKYDFTYTVIKVTLPHTAAYYYVDKLGSDINDIVEQINIKYPNGFQNLTILPDNSIQAVTILTKARTRISVGAWAFGEQPGNISIKNNGVFVKIINGNITNYGFENPEHNTICHEMGHCVFGWPDHYNVIPTIGNIGHYCLMGSGGSSKKPMPISTPLRYKKGWITTVNEITNSSTQTYTITSNSYNQVYKYTNVNNPKEYFLISAYVHNGYYLSLTGDNYVPDQGLAIWYVDEDGGYEKPNFTIAPRIRLVQADGIDEMNDPQKNHHDLRGDDTDMFDNIFNKFNDALYPTFRWKDGSLTGLNLSEISAPGATMTFKFNAKTASVSTTATVNGKISPAGLVNITPGQSKVFNFIPDPGYAVDQVLVNGVNQGAIASYTFNNVNANHTLSVTFKVSSNSYLLPAPWTSTDIGAPTNAGASNFVNYSYTVKAFGTDIWGNYDQFHFAYKPLAGDGEIIAKVSLLTLADWTKAGLMIRESLAPDAKHFMAVKTGWNGIATQWRSTSGGGSDNINNQNLNIENWIKIVRTGNIFTSYYSRDGISWTYQYSTNIAMSANAYVGFAAIGTNDIAQKAVFENVTVTGTNLPPTVNITSPINNASFTVPANITISANATDADGVVSKVEFFNGTTKLGEDVSAPFAFTWNNVAAGNYAITAKATDNTGASTTTSPMNITVVNNGTCNEPQYVAGSVYATGVVVKNNNKKYTCNVGGWCSSAAAWAYEPGVGSAWQSAWTETGVCGGTNLNPTVSITSPNNNATFTAPATINITATAADADGTVSKVEFFNGTIKLGEDLTAPFTYSWNNVSAGTYTVTAKATDNAGASTISASIALVVNGSGTCTAQQWTSVAYNGGAIVQYNGIKYLANWWTQNERPDLNNGPTGSGKPWTSQGNCTARVDHSFQVKAISVIAPNPVSNESTLFLNLENDDHIDIIVLDRLGKKVLDVHHGPLTAGNTEINIDGSSLPTGLYVLNIKGMHTNQLINFIKQ